MTSTWVVIPTFNEAENVTVVVRSVLDAAPAANVLVVDDASPDGTGALADALARQHPAVRVLHRQRRRGLGDAYRDGFARVLGAGAHVVVQMDADLSHDPADVPRLVEAVLAGADLAVGSRYVPGGRTVGWSRSRRALSRAGGTYARLLLRSRVRDLTGGFKAWNRETLMVALAGDTRSDGYAFQIETTVIAERSGARIHELPIAFRDRERGSSKMSMRIAIEAARIVPGLRRRRRRARSGRLRNAT